MLSLFVNVDFPAKSRRARHPRRDTLGLLCTKKNNMAAVKCLSTPQENVAENVVIKKSDDNKGKALFAKRSFTKREIIFQEEPLVSAQFLWNSEYKYLACDL